MSVSSMANIAFSRRADESRDGKGLDTLDKVDEAKGGTPGSGNSATTALSAIAAYIPTEVVTVYVAVLATLGVTVPAAGGGDGPETATPIAVYVVFIVLTPIIVWGLYASRAVAAKKRVPRRFHAWPKWEMAAATVAFAAWGAAMPSSPLEIFPWFSAALAGVVALILSLLIGVFAPLFSAKPLGG